MPASRARYDDERRGRSMARGASMPAWRARERQEEDMYRRVCIRVSSGNRAIGCRCMKGALTYLTRYIGGAMR